MFAKVKRYIHQYNLINPGDSIIAAVSGGPDSMALLHMLQRLRPEMELHLAAAHLNHGLRPEADDEQAFVEGYCAEAGIKCYSRSVRIDQIAEREGKSAEEAGRDCRYEFFQQLSDELEGALIATAHHQDDRAEGVLLNLIRGTGIKGLRSVMPINGRVIRPLLSLTRDDIMAYLQENEVTYCIDNSNYDPVYLRNRVRLGLLPYLRSEFNPNIVKGLNQLAELAAEENDWIERHCDKCWSYIATETDQQVVLRVPHLSELHLAMQRRVILRALAHFDGEAGWSMDDVAYVRTLLKQTGSSKVLQLKKQVKVKKVYDELHFTREEETTDPFYYQVMVPGTLYIEETGQALEFFVEEAGAGPGELHEVYLDYDKLADQQLVIRSRRPGDYFYPAGMPGGKKLKEYFIDIKLPYRERDRVPLLVGENGVIHAVIGWRIAQSAARDPATKRLLVIRTTPNN